MRYILIFSLAIIIAMTAFKKEQDFKITGFVKDQTGAPVSNVAVTELKSGMHTVSADDGSFSMMVHSRKVTLRITANGFIDANIQTNEDGSPVQIILVTVNLPDLQDVVMEREVFSKKNLSGAIASSPSARGHLLGANYRGKQKIGRQGANEKYFSKGLKADSFNTEEYDDLTENRFLSAAINPLSTFSIDVDGGSYSNVRRFLDGGQLPPAGAVRVEEFINYFHYEYPQPTGENPFSINTEISNCAWNPAHRLVMIGLQGKKIPTENLPSSNLVFLIDVSGSMMEENKLPLVQRSLKMLVDQLRESDRVSLVVYAGNAGVALPATSGADKQRIKSAIDQLEAGGSTAGGEGILLAYKIAAENFITGGNNRVVLCTDGDFNVGPSSDSDLETIIEKQRKSGVFLTVLGYGMGNYKDSKMEKLADKGNGNHAYIDNANEAKKVLITEFCGTLFTIAKDVKLQIEFNSSKVQAYRLIGYENRMLNKEDFNNDEKDAGELGSGHTVTALYEVIPVGVPNEFYDAVDPLKYQHTTTLTPTGGDEMMTIQFRYKKPMEEKSRLIVHVVRDVSEKTSSHSNNFQFVTAVAEFGMLLRNSAFRQSSSFDGAYGIAKQALGTDTEGYRKEFLQLIGKAKKLQEAKGSLVEQAVR